MPISVEESSSVPAVEKKLNALIDLLTATVADLQKKYEAAQGSGDGAKNNVRASDWLTKAGIDDLADGLKKLGK